MKDSILDLIPDIQSALNQISNRALSGRFKNTYALAKALDKASPVEVLFQVSEGSVQEPVLANADASNLKITLVNYDRMSASVPVIVPIPSGKLSNEILLDSIGERIHFEHSVVSQGGAK